MMLSVVTPAFNEAENLEPLHRRLVETMRALGIDWEWLVVDDHSADGTFDLVRRLADLDSRVRGIRLARNGGSHVALACGLHHVRGDAAVMLAADLQDPPEMIGAMVDRWRNGAQIVWAVRRTRPGDRAHTGFAAAYYWMMRHVVGLKEMPATGSDCFLVDRAVVDAFGRLAERNVSVLALITWMGFRQELVEYEKQPRASGRSGWTLTRKVKLVADSVTAFSAAPLRACAVVGGGLIFVGGALLVVGLSPWPDVDTAMMLLAAVTGLAGLQLLALGVIGEYVWRALDESRRRPAYLIEASANCAPISRHVNEPATRLK